MSEDPYFYAGAVIPHNGLKTMADRGVRVMIDTMELKPEDLARLFSFKGSAGVFAWYPAEVDVNKIEVPDIKPDFQDEVSPSKRMRSVLYRLWEQGGASGTFEAYYRQKMEQLIDKLKTNLD